MAETRYLLFCAILLLSTLVAWSLPQENPEEGTWPFCTQKCQGEAAHKEAQEKGAALCLSEADDDDEPFDGFGSPYSARTSCEIECMGLQSSIAKDQQKCFCEICKNMPGEGWNSFCTAPKTGQLKSPKECQKTVCAGTGGVKYHGSLCDS